VTTAVRERWLPLLGFAGAWFLAFVSVGIAFLGRNVDGLVDANTYWAASRGPMYAEDYVLWARGYSYPPPFAQAFDVLSWMPWEIARWVWLGGVLVAYAWLLAPLRLGLRIPLVITLYVFAADNLYWILALVAVFSFRYPFLWAVPLLTKITPGVGVLWFAVRQEWRAFAIAIGATLAIAAVSFLSAPDLWSQWLRLMLGQDLSGTTTTNFFVWVPPLPIRGVAALALVVWGASTDRRWVIPVSMLLAQPDIAFSALGLLAAIPRLRSPAPARQRVPVPQRVAV
jgi:hypothetical protein